MTLQSLALESAGDKYPPRQQTPLQGIPNLHLNLIFLLPSLSCEQHHHSETLLGFLALLQSKPDYLSETRLKPALSCFHTAAVQVQALSSLLLIPSTTLYPPCASWIGPLNPRPPDWSYPHNCHQTTRQKISTDSVLLIAENCCPLWTKKKKKSRCVHPNCACSFKGSWTLGIECLFTRQSPTPLIYLPDLSPTISPLCLTFTLPHRTLHSYTKPLTCSPRIFLPCMNYALALRYPLKILSNWPSPLKL